MQKVLILGSGMGGIVAANVLKRVASPGTQVLVVNRNNLYHFPGAFPLLLIGQREPQDITRDLRRSLAKKGIEFLQAEVVEINPAKRQITTTRGKLGYDYLVISLGVDYHPETVPGFSQYAFNVYEFEDVLRARKEISSFPEGRIVLFISSLPFKCPPAPYEIIFLLDQYFRQRGNRRKISLTMVTPEPGPEPLAGPLVGQSVRRMLVERGIDLRTEAKVLALEPEALVLDHGVRIPGDLFLGIAPHWSPDVIRKTNLVDAYGWVEVNPKTLRTRFPEVYAVGDVTGIRLPVLGVYAPKAGIFAHYQAEVVARNIGQQLQGLAQTFKYTGKGL